MMGIMQWMMLEDSLYVYAQEVLNNGQFKIKANAQIIKDNGVLVTEIKQAVLNGYQNVANIYDQVEIIQTHKIAFRDMVKPGDKLFCVVSITSIEYD